MKKESLPIAIPADYVDPLYGKVGWCAVHARACRSEGDGLERAECGWDKPRVAIS